MKVKYPRTFHMPYSECLAGDDKYVKNPDMFDGMDVVVTLKMDGENTTLYRNCSHARSLDSRHHWSRDWLKEWHSKFSHDIPENMRICGENLYAVHAVCYADLKSYFYGFSVWIDDTCLSWNDTLEWFQLFGIDPVDEIYRGVYDETRILDAWKSFSRFHEGFVIRNSGSFEYDDFNSNVAKFVRSNHVRETEQHWTRRKPELNKLMKS